MVLNALPEMETVPPVIHWTWVNVRITESGSSIFGCTGGSEKADCLIWMGHLSLHDEWRSLGHFGQFPRFVQIRSQWLYNLQKWWKETERTWL